MNDNAIGRSWDEVRIQLFTPDEITESNLRVDLIGELIKSGSMLEMPEKSTGYTHDIAYYAKDSRLTEPSDGKQYEWRKMIDLSKKLGRPLTDDEAEEFRIE